MFKFKEVLNKISIFSTIISGSILFVIFCRPLYIFVLRYSKISQKVHLSETVILKNYDNLMQFLFQPWQKKLILPNFKITMTSLSHFYEVRQLFLLVGIVFLLTIFPTCKYLKKIKQNKIWWKIVLPMKRATVFWAIFAFLSLLFFDLFFVMFHELIFQNDKWLFDPVRDDIIKILPEGYFFACFTLFFLISEINFITFWLIGKRSCKNLRKKTRL